MAASELYRLMIENPTKNAQKHLTKGDKDWLSVTDLQPNNRDFTQQWDLDAAMWYGAIHTGPFQRLLRKIFHIFFHAGVMCCRNDDGWLDWSDTKFGIASLLSHGQRVLVQIPTVEKGGDRLWEWLNKPKGSGFDSRWFATHDQRPLQSPRYLDKGRHQYVIEIKKGKKGEGKGDGKHHKIDVALGGAGNRNPFSATNKGFSFKAIKGNGLNGEVYVNYMKPGKGRVGGMLIGCENAQSCWTNPHTEASHGAGGHSQKISACGGKKWSELKCGPLTEYNGFICDLIDDPRSADNLDWLINAPRFDPNLLDGPTKPVPTNVVLEPDAGRKYGL